MKASGGNSNSQLGDRWCNFIAQSVRELHIYRAGPAVHRHIHTDTHRHMLLQIYIRPLLFCVCETIQIKKSYMHILKYILIGFDSSHIRTQTIAFISPSPFYYSVCTWFSTVTIIQQIQIEGYSCLCEQEINLWDENKL